MAKQVLYDIEARQKLTRGMETLSRAVRATLGPTGKNVILDKSFSRPHSTKDGITVSKEVELPDPFENMGAKIINEVAARTNDKVGDGTSTAVVFADAMMREGRKYLAAGVSPIAIRSGIQKAVARAVEALESQAIAVKSTREVKQVGYIASNSDEQLGELFGTTSRKESAESLWRLSFAECKFLGPPFEKEPIVAAGNPAMRKLLPSVYMMPGTGTSSGASSPSFIAAFCMARTAGALGCNLLTMNDSSLAIEIGPGAPIDSKLTIRSGLCAIRDSA